MLWGRLLTCGRLVIVLSKRRKTSRPVGNRPQVGTLPHTVRWRCRVLNSFAPSSAEYQRILPEIILTLAGTLIMLLEVLFRDEQKRIFPALSIVALIAAFGAALVAEPGAAFQGM